MNRTLTILSLLATFAFAACTGPQVQVQTPDGFAELEKQKRYEYRAANAQGVVLAVRREANEPRGDLAFWSGAVDAQLRRAGYTALSANEVETATGVTGRQIRYKIVRHNREHAFWVSVFVLENAVITVEVGGDHAFFDQLEKPIEAAIQSLRLS